MSASTNRHHDMFSPSIANDHTERRTIGFALFWLCERFGRKNTSQVAFRCESAHDSSWLVGITGQSLPILRVCEVCSASGSDLGRSTPGRDAMRYDSLYPIFRPRRTTPKVTGPETATRSSSKNAGL